MKPYVWKLAPVTRPAEPAKVALSEAAQARLELQELRRERNRDWAAEAMAKSRILGLEARRGR